MAGEDYLTTMRYTCLHWLCLMNYEEEEFRQASRRTRSTEILNGCVNFQICSLDLPQ